MKNYLEKAKEYLKKFSKSEDYRYHGINPTRDWIIILISSQVIVTCLALVAIFLYIKIDAGNIFTVESKISENEAKINMNLLQKVVADINQREQDMILIKQNSNIPNDPSV